MFLNLPGYLRILYDLGFAYSTSRVLQSETTRDFLVRQCVLENCTGPLWPVYSFMVVIGRPIGRGPRPSDGDSQSVRPSESDDQTARPLAALQPGQKVEVNFEG